jgi:hypothetical protein
MLARSRFSRFATRGPTHIALTRAAKATVVAQGCCQMCSLITRSADADDRLPLAPLGRVEVGDGMVEGRDVADVCPRSSVPHQLIDSADLFEDVVLVFSRVLPDGNDQFHQEAGHLGAPVSPVAGKPDSI